MYVRLAFAVAAHLEPEILIIDEVLAVGDAEFQKKCLGKMKEVAGHGRTVIFVSHNMEAVKNLCDRALFMEEGKLILDGDPVEIIEQYLERQSSLTLEQNFYFENAPGNAFVKMKHISLVPERADGKNIITVKSPLKISFEFWIETEEMATNLRYSWLGELSRMKAIQALASCQLLVQSSLTEGGPSAVSEAISMGVPVLSTPTSGVLGVMGQEYPGYFPFTDEQALADLLLRCEENPDFLGNLRLHCHQIRPLFETAAEQLAWSEFLAELGLPAGATG